MGGVALPSGFSSGGGHVYTTGEISGEFIAEEPVTGGVQLTFTIFDPLGNDPGGGALKASGWYVKEDGTEGQMTISAVGQGSLAANVNSGLGAGVGNTFVWNMAADLGVTTAYTDKFVRIYQ